MYARSYKFSTARGTGQVVSFRFDMEPERNREERGGGESVGGTSVGEFGSDAISGSGSGTAASPVEAA
jgi:hypothetical protein